MPCKIPRSRARQKAQLGQLRSESTLSEQLTLSLERLTEAASIFHSHELFLRSFCDTWRHAVQVAAAFSDRVCELDQRCEGRVSSKGLEALQA